MASESTNDVNEEITKIYRCGQRLSGNDDESLNAEDYKRIIEAATSSITEVKQFAIQLTQKYYDLFPDLNGDAVNMQCNLCKDENLGIRMQVIRALPLFCEGTPEHIPKITDVLAQLLLSEEEVERDAVEIALQSLLHDNVKESLTALFKHIQRGTNDNLRERTLAFIRDKVFPFKSELFNSQTVTHITDLVKQSIQDFNGAEFKMFMDFFKREKAHTQRVQELVEIIDGQVDLDADFSASDGNQVDRLISALPFFVRASSSKFVNYLSKHMLPLFNELPEEKKVDLLKNLAESSFYAAPQDSRQILPFVVQLLKKYMPISKAAKELKVTYVECLLYTFHHLANKAPDIINRLCGYEIVTSQPSDMLDEEEFRKVSKLFKERLRTVEYLTKRQKLIQGGNSRSNTKGDISKEEKARIETQKQIAKTGLHTCDNILDMIQPLYSISPSLIGDNKIKLSWNVAVKEVDLPSTVTRKRQTHWREDAKKKVSSDDPPVPSMKSSQKRQTHPAKFNQANKRRR